MHIQANQKQDLLMLKLKAKLKALNEIIGSKHICYLDLPIHHNFGDLLIMLGTLDFFKVNGFVQTHRLTIFNYFSKAISPKAVIVFQGGGNFGDIHPAHQIHREKVIAAFPNNKIVILPQTIFFHDQRNYEKTCELLLRHKNLHICVRDEKSYALALKMTSNVYLLPDMAHELYPSKSNKHLKHQLVSILQLKRDDLESNKLDINLPVDNIVDWKDFIGELNYLIILIRRIQQVLDFFKLNRLTSRFTSSLWLRYSNYLSNKVISRFDRFHVIHSSRLHGFILANLLKKEVFLIDNSYGKNSAYFDTWFK